MCKCQIIADATLEVGLEGRQKSLDMYHCSSFCRRHSQDRSITSCTTIGHWSSVKGYDANCSDGATWRICSRLYLNFLKAKFRAVWWLDVIIFDPVVGYSAARLWFSISADTSPAPQKCPITSRPWSHCRQLVDTSACWNPFGRLFSANTLMLQNDPL